MLEHHIQKAIVYKLAFSSDLRFSELQPEELENKLFDYHLKIVVRDGYVEKNEDGLYRLTPKGRRVGVRAFEKQLALADRAEPVLILVVRQDPSSDSPYLLYRRSIHPMLGKVGFMHAIPVVGESIAESATKQCLEKTGLTCEFKIMGSGYFTTYESDVLESFINFTLLVSDHAEGELKADDSAAEYFWQTNPDFSSKDMIPNMETLAKHYLAGKPFTIEQTFRY